MDRTGTRETMVARLGRWSTASYASLHSIGSVLSILSLYSAGSVLSIGSAGSILSIGSTGSILSIGSVGSILSIGSAGSIFSIGSLGRFPGKNRIAKVSTSNPGKVEFANGFKIRKNQIFGIILSVIGVERDSIEKEN